MRRMYPFFIQYHVRQADAFAKVNNTPEGFATIIVFAESSEQACARAGRAVAENRLEIIQFVRIHLISPQAMNSFDSVLKKLYSTAERYGFGLLFDRCPISNHNRSGHRTET